MGNPPSPLGRASSPSYRSLSVPGACLGSGYNRIRSRDPPLTHAGDPASVFSQGCRNGGGPARKGFKRSASDLRYNQKSPPRVNRG